MPGKDAGLLEWALWYHGLGLCIIPIRAGTKRPALPKWKPYQTRRPTVAQLREWFGRRGVGGLAVILGPVSGGLCCRDFDKAGAFDAWAESHAGLAGILPRSRTPRGHHVLYRAAARTTKQADGENRGRDTYILLPPSVHPSGAAYEWEVPLAGDVPEVDPAEFVYKPSPDQGGSGVTHAMGVAVYGCVTGESDGCVTPPTGYVTPADGEAVPPMTVAEIVEAARVNGPGERNGSLLLLARGLKFNAVDAPADVPGLLRVVKGEWWAPNLERMRTKDWETSRADFEHAYERAAYPLGICIQRRAVALARSRPLPAGVAELADLLTDDPAGRLLVAACYWMGTNAPTFFLSCPNAEELLSEAVGRYVDRKQVGRWYKALERMGVLECKVRGTQGTGGRATVYRWTGPRESEGREVWPNGPEKEEAA